MKAFGYHEATVPGFDLFLGEVGVLHQEIHVFLRQLLFTPGATHLGANDVTVAMATWYKVSTAGSCSGPYHGVTQPATRTYNMPSLVCLYSAQCCHVGG